MNIKNTYNIFLLLLILIIVNLGKIKAQDALLSQYYSAPLYLAPSFAGSTDGSRLVMNYRNQWPGIKKTYQVYSVSYDHFLPQYNSGVGVIILKDIAGTANLNRTNIGLQYSYNIKLNRYWVLKPGVQIQMTQTSLDFEKLVFYEQLTFKEIIPQNSETNTVENKTYLDFSGSILAFNNITWVGMVLDHFNIPNESMQNSISNVPSRFRMFAGRKIYLNNKKTEYNEESLSFSFVYKAQKKFDQLDVGAYWLKMPFVVGLWYRGLPVVKYYEKGYSNNDAIIILFGYQIKSFKAGYSYDFTISKLVSNSYGSHEISLVYLFLQDQKVRKKRRLNIVPCPKF